MLDNDALVVFATSTQLSVLSTPNHIASGHNPRRFRVSAVALHNGAIALLDAIESGRIQPRSGSAESGIVNMEVYRRSHRDTTGIGYSQKNQTLRSNQHRDASDVLLLGNHRTVGSGSAVSSTACSILPHVDATGLQFEDVRSKTSKKVNPPVESFEMGVAEDAHARKNREDMESSSHTWSYLRSVERPGRIG